MSCPHPSVSLRATGFPGDVYCDACMSVVLCPHPHIFEHVGSELKCGICHKPLPQLPLIGVTIPVNKERIMQKYCR